MRSATTSPSPARCAAPSPRTGTTSTATPTTPSTSPPPPHPSPVAPTPLPRPPFLPGPPPPLLRAANGSWRGLPWSGRTSPSPPSNSVGFQKSWLVFPMGCNMTSVQKAKIDDLEQKIRPQIPLYITAMDMTSMSGGFLAISKDYALKYLLDKDGTITLSQIHGSKTWKITLDTNTVGWYALSTGWLSFICDNGLKEGDICIFEPSKGTRRVVTLIFHPLEETHHPKSAGYVPSSRSPPHEATEHRYIVPRFTVLNSEQMYKIKNKVQAIGSPYPVFVCIMKPRNVAENSCCMVSHHCSV